MPYCHDCDGGWRRIIEEYHDSFGSGVWGSHHIHRLTAQVHGELAKDYYERVVQIRVKLQEFHCYMFRPGDLEHQAKEAFFNGLRPEFQSMVVHKRDDPSEHHEITRRCEGM